MKTETNHLKQIKIQFILFEKNHFIYKIIKTRATKKNIAYGNGESLSKFFPKNVTNHTLIKYLKNSTLFTHKNSFPRVQQH